MKIKSITLQGFRGFNEKRTIDLNDKLTLIYAPNSYGKTSISESLEWLLYGITSKVERALLSEEYKGSYRNLHLDASEPAFVKAAFLDKDGKDVNFTGVLSPTDGIMRFVDGQQIDKWPVDYDLSEAPQPFILQHALKYLLLAKPDDRFKGFAHLLGLESLDVFQRNIQSLCTKAEVCLPDEATLLLNKVSTIESRLESQSKLSTVNKEYKKGAPNLKKVYGLIDKECRKRVPPETKDESILPQLLKKRVDAIKKIFEGSIVLLGYSGQEKAYKTFMDKYFANFVDADLCKNYIEIAALKASRDIRDQIKFYGLGIAIIDNAPGKCPFCEQSVDSQLDEHIRSRHKKLIEEQSDNERLVGLRSTIQNSFSNLNLQLQSYHSMQLSKTSELLSLEESLDDLKKIFLPKYKSHYENIESALSLIKSEKALLPDAYKNLSDSVSKATESIKGDKENISFLKNLSSNLIAYVIRSIEYSKAISDNINPMDEADKILQHELDEIAGTEDISILVDLIENRNLIEKNFEIRQILNKLKDFRSAVDEYVANRIIDAISDELTSNVMEWYDQIKTTGDPDVHFSGFDMDRTKTGKVKSRRVKVKAESYGKELVSAVSSLSESKLNALGLCVNIAKNLKEEGPFSFLIIDDPIQSWDQDHEAQFIDLVRKLVDRGKQVLLMSHNKKWIKMVRVGCRTINGKYYEFTGYTKEGPHIKEQPWAAYKERLSEIDAIVKNPNASDVQLQWAEEEFRIVCSEATCEIYFKKKGIEKKPHKMNAEKVRKCLVEAGVDSGLVDRISQSFVSTDDAHHDADDYSPNRERIKRYYSYACDLIKQIR